MTFVVTRSAPAQPKSGGAPTRSGASGSVSRGSSRLASSACERKVGAWRLAEGVREYVEVLRDRLPELDEEDRSRVAAWCDWAEAWAERSDPAANVSRIAGLGEETRNAADLWSHLLLRPVNR